MQNGEALSDAERLPIPRIAIYLDGYQYHATAQNQRFGNDVARRNAVLQSGQYRVWTLTWPDLERFDAGLAGPGVDGQSTPPEAVLDELALLLKSAGYVKTTSSLLALPTAKTYKPVWLARNNMERLLCLLSNPVSSPAQRASWSWLLACYQPMLFRPSFDAETARSVAAFDAEPAGQTYIKGASQLNDGYMLASPWPDNTLFQTRLLVNLREQPAWVGLRETPLPSDLDRTDWQAYWWVHNLVQFGQPVSPAPSETVAGTLATEAVLDYYDAPYHDLVKVLLARRISFGEDGSYLLLGSQGEQVAEAVLGFTEARIVVDPLGDADKKAFLQAGYRVESITTFSLTDLADEALTIR